MPNIDILKTAVRMMSLDGWLFSGFQHRDILSDELLELSAETTSTRRWFYIVFAAAPPLKIVHTIESNVLNALPGNTMQYSSEAELDACLSRLRNMRLAAHYDIHIPVFSFLDAGIYQRLLNCGIHVYSATPLIQQVKGIRSDNEQHAHRCAAKKLYDITRQTWDFITAKKNTGITESQALHFICSQFTAEGLVTDHSPIVAFGKNTANPHYEAANSDTKLYSGDPVQLDMWAKLPGGIYADISWFGIASQKIPYTIQKNFDMLMQTRDKTVSFIADMIANKKTVTGADVDYYTRSCFEQSGLLSAVKHRTGHAIDTECHGCGVNLDSTEFPDFRPIGNGCLFSVEPGLYFSDYGMRTEINVLIQNETCTITGDSHIQHTMLHM